MAQKIRRDDMVVVITGKDKGTRGRVRRSLPKERRVVVEGVNLIKRHLRARPGVRQAGIVQMEGPISTSKIMLVCVSCDEPVRVGFSFLEDGRKVRRCKKCNETID